MSRSSPVRRPVPLHGQGIGGRAPANVPDQLRGRIAGHAVTGHGQRIPKGTGDGYRGYRSQASHGSDRRSRATGNKLFLRIKLTRT